jgi:hypothetical protein
MSQWKSLKFSTYEMCPLKTICDKLVNSFSVCDIQFLLLFALDEPNFVRAHKIIAFRKMAPLKLNLYTIQR